MGHSLCASYIEHGGHAAKTVQVTQHAAHHTAHHAAKLCRTNAIYVQAAGGVGSSVNGKFIVTGTYNYRPMYTQEDGKAIIFFCGTWRINCADDTQSWLYSMPNSFQHYPPAGFWESESTAAEPAPYLGETWNTDLGRLALPGPTRTQQLIWALDSHSRHKRYQLLRANEQDEPEQVAARASLRASLHAWHAQNGDSAAETSLGTKLPKDITQPRDANVGPRKVVVAEVSANLQCRRSQVPVPDAGHSIKRFYSVYEEETTLLTLANGEQVKVETTQRVVHTNGGKEVSRKALTRQEHNLSKPKKVEQRKLKDLENDFWKTTPKQTEHEQVVVPEQAPH